MHVPVAPGSAEGGIEAEGVADERRALARTAQDGDPGLPAAIAVDALEQRRSLSSGAERPSVVRMAVRSGAESDAAGPAGRGRSQSTAREATAVRRRHRRGRGEGSPSGSRMLARFAGRPSPCVCYRPARAGRRGGADLEPDGTGAGRRRDPARAHGLRHPLRASSARQPRAARLERRRARRAASPATARAGSAAWPIPATGSTRSRRSRAGSSPCTRRARARSASGSSTACPQRVRDDPEQMKLRASAVIAMPAWRGVLSARETDDLVAFVKAVSDFETPTGARGVRRAGGGDAAGLLQLPRSAGPRVDAERARLQGLHPVVGRSRLPGAGPGRRRDPGVDPRRPAAAAAARAASPASTSTGSASRCRPIGATWRRAEVDRLSTTSTGCAPTRTRGALEAQLPDRRPQLDRARLLDVVPALVEGAARARPGSAAPAPPRPPSPSCDRRGRRRSGRAAAGARTAARISSKSTAESACSRCAKSPASFSSTPGKRRRRYCAADPGQEQPAQPGRAPARARPRRTRAAARPGRGAGGGPGWPRGRGGARACRARRPATRAVPPPMEWPRTANRSSPRRIREREHDARAPAQRRDRVGDGRAPAEAGQVDADDAQRGHELGRQVAEVAHRIPGCRGRR